MTRSDLLQGEEILFNKKGLVVTNYRVRLSDSDSFCSILLKNVSSVSSLSKRNYWLLISAILFILGAIGFGTTIGRDFFSFGLFAGVLCVVGFVQSIKDELVISSKGGNRIVFRSDFLDAETIANLVEASLKKELESV
jgi:hypothetical protein